MTIKHKPCFIIGIVMLAFGSAARLIGLFSAATEMINTLNSVTTSPKAPHPTDLANSLSESLTGTGIGLAIGLVFETCGVVFIVIAVVAFFRHRRIHISVAINEEDMAPTSESERNDS